MRRVRIESALYPADRKEFRQLARQAAAIAKTMKKLGQTALIITNTTPINVKCPSVIRVDLA